MHQGTENHLEKAGRRLAAWVATGKWAPKGKAQEHSALGSGWQGGSQTGEGKGERRLFGLEWSQGSQRERKIILKAEEPSEQPPPESFASSC